MTILMFRWFYANKNILVSIMIHYCQVLQMDTINPTDWTFKFLFSVQNVLTINIKVMLEGS